ncbi:MAG: hypothetical protein LBS12_04680 [Prevotellaceae bacterium]|jgi:hypothetical protein|nr:hypothetical protein [Prevotellaceae bacterium]
MKTSTFFVWLGAGLLLFAGCLGEYNPPEIKRTDVIVLINEGSATEAGSVRLYIENQATLNEPLSDLTGNVRAVSMFEQCLWVTTNNPDAVHIVDMEYGRRSELPATELQTPRYTNYYGSKLLVSNWGDSVTAAGEHPESFVAVYSLSDYSRPPTILPCGSDAEAMMVNATTGRLFVATKQGVAVFDLTKSTMPRDALIVSTQFHGNAKQFVADSTGTVWVSYTDGGIMGFDPTTFAVTAEYPVPIDTATGAIAIDGDWIRVLSYSPSPAVIYATDLTTGVTEERVRNSAYHFTSIGVCPASGNIYSSDTKSDDKSTLLIFDKTGRKQAEYADVGIRTKGYIYFYAESY